VADDAADGCTTDGSYRAAPRENGTSDSANPGADGGTFVLCRHAGATAQAKQHYCGNCTDCQTLFRFHWITSFKELCFGCFFVVECSDYLPKFALGCFRQSSLALPAYVSHFSRVDIEIVRYRSFNAVIPGVTDR
jgi:hypothetical protein